MHTQQEWEDARDLDSLLGGIDFNEMLSNVFNKAYEQKPELFAGAQWINNEYGYPLWVRPGVDWVPDDDEEDDFF